VSASIAGHAGFAGSQASRRAVLIDFDWQDSDLIPALLRQPGLAVRLVAGERNDEAGLRVAELCGLPRTVDLADLTREIFDVALVSERSPRRTQVEGLLLALGTPSSTPQSYLDGLPIVDQDTPAIEAPLALHAAAFEDALGGEAFAALVEQALPDLSSDAPTVPGPVHPTALPASQVRSLDDFPSLEDRQGLEEALRALMASTGAESAEFHAGRSDQVQRVVHAGKEDALLRGLVEMALEVNQPQVVSRMTGPEQGKIWGAWPFRTTQHRGVLAAAGIGAPTKCSPWEKMVDELKTTWDRHDRELTAPAFPMVPDSDRRWLSPDEFAANLELAVERNRRDGLRFAVHRLEFSDAPEAFAVIRDRLPEQLRDTDSICNVTPCVVLLLAAGPAAAFLHVRRRLLALWEQSWNDARLIPPPPPIVDQHIEMLGPDDAEGFLANAGGWLQTG
jgi:hypothetical protein